MLDRAVRLKAGLVWSGASSVVVALLGLATILSVARLQGPVGYAEFAVSWGLFFGLGGLFAGLQQEVTRSATGQEDGAGRPALLPLALLLGLPVGAAGALLVGVGVPDPSLLTGLAIGVGLVSLAGMTFLSGVLASRLDWPALAGVLVLDAATRAVAVVFLAGTDRPSLLPAAIASGSGAWLALLVLPRFRLALIVRAGTDSFGFLSRAVVAMAATGSAALLVAGLPVLVATFHPGPLDGGAGAVLAALVVLRSGLLIPVYGYRPLILRVLLAGDRAHKVVWHILSWGALGGVAWTLVAVTIGPPALALLLGDNFTVTPRECAALAFGATGIMMMVVAGLALVARDRHLASTAGWLAALGATVAVAPLPEAARSSVIAASLVGPWVGFVVHACCLLKRSEPVRERR